jgi:hypothetical protein
MHILNDDQPTADHLVEDRQQSVDFLRPVHDFEKPA